MNKQYDLAIVLPHYESGGAQKVTHTLLDEFSKSGNKCALIIIFNNHQDKYKVPENVDRFNISSSSKKEKPKLINLLEKYLNRNIIYILLLPKRIINTLSVIFILRKTLTKINPKTVVSFLTVANILTIGASTFRPWRVVISERNDVSKQENVFPLGLIRSYFYNKSDIVTANTEHSLRCMEHYVNSEKLKYVPNPINLPLEYTTSNERNGFLFIGRLVPQKSVDTLVKAFCIAKQHFHGWTLDIVGDGPELNKLKAIVHQNQAEDCVVFHGYQTDVSAYYKKNAIFILPSLYEGLPNVLLEAMTFSMPIIVSDSCPGSVELTAAGECGVTFPANDYVALSSAMADLAKDKEKIKVMGKNSRTKVADFKTPNVLDTWHKIIFEENGC